MCRSSAAVKLLASESDRRGFESRRQLFFLFFFFFFFFFNIHTSDKLEIFFDHSILVNGVDPWGVHRFLGGINHENGIYSMGQRHECGLAQRLNYWPPNLTDEGSSPGVSFSFFFFFFFFFNIHTSDKLEIFFDHSILVNGVDPWGVHRFLGGINHENGIYSMGQRHECGLGYIIITIYEVAYKIE